MATSSGYDPYWDAYPPMRQQLYRTRALGDLVVTRRPEPRYGATTLCFHHTALDIHVEHIVSDDTLFGFRGADIMNEIGRTAERRMLQMLRERINPPKPKPAPPKYAVSNGSSLGPLYLVGKAGGYGKWTDSLNDAQLFDTQEQALKFVGRYTLAHGVTLVETAHIVRVDVVTQTLEKRVATVLK